MDNPVILVVAGSEITNSDVSIYLKATGAYKDAIQELVRRKAVSDYAEKNNISVSDDELQNEVNDKRKELKLFATQDVQKYLSGLGLNIDQWADWLDYSLLESKVKDAVITEDGIEKYFAENKLQFRKVHLYKISLDNKDKSDEIYMELNDDGKKFFDLALQYSNDDTTKYGGGYMGEIGRGTLKLMLEQKVFATQPGDLVGPVEDNGNFSIYKVADYIDAELTDDFKAKLKDTLFKMWNSGYLQSIKVELPK